MRVHTNTHELCGVTLESVLGPVERRSENVTCTSYTAGAAQVLP